MARLAFCDYHNMIAILDKYEHNVDFYPLVDFVEASHIRIETTDEGTKILATVDGKPRTISESSIRRNLKLNDEAGISSLPDAELFENLAQMGTVPLFASMLVHQGEGSRNPTEPHHTPFPESSVLPTVADESASPLGDDSQGETCPTVSDLEAEQDRKNIIKTLPCPMTHHQGLLPLLLMRAGRSLETGEEAAIEKSTKRVSNDTEELVNVLTFLDATSILTSGVQVVSVPPAAEVATVSIPTGSGMVPTASPIFTTASVVTPYSRRKAKEMEEKIAREDQRMNEQIARDAEIARIHAEEKLQMLIDGLDRTNETIVKYLQEYEQFVGMSLEEIREKFILVWKHIKDFVPMGSKEEGERAKRKGLRLEQEIAKKGREPIGRLSGWEGIQLSQFFVGILKHFDREDLNQLWTLVRETLSIRQATCNKDKELWVELKKLHEPDVEDQLWTQTQALMHDPVDVPTGSGVVPTASPIFTTATVATPYLRRKGKEKMVESETPKKKKVQEQMDVQMARQLEEEMARDAQIMNEQIDRDAEIARIHVEEEL
nr:hypothetical protein [Tanacetum cinerariifolium]